VSLGGDHRLPQQLEGRYYFGSRWLSYGIEYAVLRLCDAIIVPNAFTHAYVAGIIGEARARAKVEIIPWAIIRRDDVDQSEARRVAAHAGIDPTRPFVLSVGHLNKYKFAPQMFEVAQRLLRDNPRGLQFVFCGDGPLVADGRRRLNDCRDAHFLGWQSNDTVRALMTAAAVVVVPMSGFVLLEAAAIGRPVVTSNLEWHTELVRDADTGWVVDPADVTAWCDRIIRIIDDPALGERAGARLRDAFDAGFAPGIALRKEVELYRRLVK
jgi:glycosyltransferase involved in cell wall biosynthesis